MIKPITKRIAAATTTTAVSSSCSLKQLIISCPDAGTSFTLRIQDKSSTPNILIPTFTLSVPSDGNPNVYLKWHEMPVPMDGGIDLITAGTPGVVVVYLTIQTGGTS